MEEQIKEVAENLLKVIDISFSDVMIPSVVSIITFWVQTAIINRINDKKKIPTVYINKLQNKKEILTNREKIQQNRRFIEILTEVCDIDDPEYLPEEKIVFREINFSELKKCLEEAPRILLEFQIQSEVELFINYIITQKDISEIDYSVVPKKMDSKQKYCFVCKCDEVPCELQGNYEEKTVRYILNGENCTISPQIIRGKNKRKGKYREKKTAFKNLSSLKF